MAREGSLVEHLRVAQRNPKHLDAYRRISHIRRVGGDEHHLGTLEFAQIVHGARVVDDHGGGDERV